LAITKGKYEITPKSFFWCALSIAPPFFPIQFLPVGKTLGFAIIIV
jgi:hypothetical protein